MKIQMDNKDPASIFLEKARSHWTKEREKKVTSGRRYPLLPSEAPLLLRTLGLLNGDATMSADAVRKYIQINHMVILLEPFFLDLCKRLPVVRVLDCGCGSSFLTFLLAWCFSERWKKECRILGIDSNPKLVEKVRERSVALGYDGFLRFVPANLGEFSWTEAYKDAFGEEGEPRPNAVVALHACDVATDLALGIGLREKADFLAVAPCCQADLARKWAALESPENPWAPVFASPNLRRDLAAHTTDAMRMLLVRGSGYEVTATEFVETEHSHKNRILLCERRGNYLDAALNQYGRLRDSLGGASIALEKQLPAWVGERLG